MAMTQVPRGFLELWWVSISLRLQQFADDSAMHVG